MRIEGAPQTRQEYQKSANCSTSKNFGQVMQTAAQDRYVPGTRSRTLQTEKEFTRAEWTYYEGAPVSNATHAKLKQLAELDKQSDYTGMSPDEIYAEIWNRYNEVFDDNMVIYTACIAGPEEWAAINNQFVGEILKHIDYPVAAAARKAAQEADGKAYGDRSYEECRDLDKFCRKKGSEASRDALYKVLGYYDMSFEEREAAIKEKYAGKNTTMDFLRMQSELDRAGVLRHKMGIDGTSTYKDLIGYQFEVAFNPNSIYRVGWEKCDYMTPDQWYRVANQPFDAAKFATETKELLSRISFSGGYPVNYEKMIRDSIDQFFKGAAENSIDRLLHETEKYYFRN